jgi:hypothetical protein
MSGGRRWLNLWIIVGTLLAVAFGSWLFVLVGDWSGWLVLIVTVGLFGVLNLEAPRSGWRHVGTAAVLAASILGLVLAPSVALATSGREVTAVVSHVNGYDDRFGHHTTYSLATLSGSPIPGQLDSPDGESYSVGEHLTVIADPTGRVDPQPHDELDVSELTSVIVVALVLAAVSQIVMWRPRQAVVGSRRQG